MATLHEQLQVLCLEPPKLPPEQIKALHAFKDKFTSGLAELYKSVPPAVADPIIVQFVNQILGSYNKKP